MGVWLSLHTKMSRSLHPVEGPALVSSSSFLRESPRSCVQLCICGGIAMVRLSWGGHPCQLSSLHRDLSRGLLLLDDLPGHAVTPWMLNSRGRVFFQILHAPHRRHCSYRAHIYRIKRISSLYLCGLVRLMLGYFLSTNSNTVSVLHQKHFKTRFDAGSQGCR